MPIPVDDGFHLQTRWPQWLIAFIAFIYSTGFLVVYTFFTDFGVKGAAFDFLKIKYIYVGFIFVLFYIITIIPIICLCYIRIINKIKDNQKERALDRNEPITNQYSEYTIDVPTIILVFNMMISFYVAILFSPKQYICDKWWMFSKPLIILVIFFSTIVGLLFLREIKRVIYRSMIEKDRNKYLFILKKCYWGLSFLILLLNFPLLYGLGSHLWEMIINGGHYFLLTTILLGYCAWRMVRLSDKNYDPDH